MTEVSLPTGGRVRLRTRLTHAQAREREDAQAALPAAAIRRVSAELGMGNPIVEDGDVAAVTAGMRRLAEATLRVAIVDSTGVRDPDGNAITLPAEIDSLDQVDFEYLASAATDALAEGFGDPNPSRGSSATPSSPDDSAGTSPRTSATPS